MTMCRVFRWMRVRTVSAAALLFTVQPFQETVQCHNFAYKVDRVCARTYMNYTGVSVALGTH